MQLFLLSIPQALVVYLIVKYSLTMIQHDGSRVPVAEGTVVSVFYRGGDSKIETFAPREGWIWPRDSRSPDDIVGYLID